MDDEHTLFTIDELRDIGLHENDPDLINTSDDGCGEIALLLSVFQ